MDYNHLLAGKRVFITSGQRGIGKDIALLFASQGAAVALGGPSKEKLEEAVREIQKLAPDSKGYQVDLSQAQETEQTCEEVLKDFGGIDILVSTVGINYHQPVHLCEDATIEKFLETNYKSGLRCARKFLPGMMERRNGNIINISSIHAVMTMPGFGIYAGTKGAMNATARAIALDYAPYGIRVNTICPGLVLSDNMMDEIHSYPEGKARDEFMDMLCKMQPLAPGSMAAVSNAALYLASDMSQYMTGQILMVDGGASIKAH
ncbi:SDR family oxidoreductase [Hydrogenoanaerobacterium sp.]|uniref:SDR family NAD(P)-dependent oxidoreductase n=1 Tax=Hydrogenoanaerobacterium sp. TaxID=2953763 RepID=UPI00289C0C1C|nr:SDR family oxidoreductase [Hydrogenoanaerobacterium sp.]